MKLQIFCPKCYPKQEILGFLSEERVVDCKQCRSRFFLRTVLVDKYKSGQVFKNNNYWEYKIIGIGPEEIPEVLKFKLEGPTNIRVGDLISEIKEKGKVIALVNHSTGSWAETKTETINVFKERYLTALKIITLVVAILTSLSLVSAISNNHQAAFMAMAIITGLVATVIILMIAEGVLSQKEVLRETVSWLRSLSK